MPNLTSTKTLIADTNPGAPGKGSGPTWGRGQHGAGINRRHSSTGDAQPMSAFGGKADMGWNRRNVRS